MADDEGLRRLADFIRRRRLDLGLTQQQAAEKGGLSGTTWRMAEKYAQPISDLSRAAIVRALGWRSDAVQIVLEGGEPPLHQDVAVPLHGIEVIGPPHHGSEHPVTAALDELLTQVDEEEGRKAAERMLAGEDPQLAAVAGAWWDMPDEDRQFIADMARRLRAARQRESQR